MTIDTNTMISITEANQNFSKVTKLVDERGTAVILKNNVPRLLSLVRRMKVRLHRMRMCLPYQKDC